MVQFLQMNWGTMVAVAAVCVLVFLAVRRMVLDKKAGIGACGQKCSQCAKMGHCEMETAPPAPPQESGSVCSGVCASCQYRHNCHQQ